MSAPAPLLVMQATAPYGRYLGFAVLAIVVTVALMTLVLFGWEIWTGQVQVEGPGVVLSAFVGFVILMLPFQVFALIAAATLGYFIWRWALGALAPGTSPATALWGGAAAVAGVTTLALLLLLMPREGGFEGFAWGEFALALGLLWGCGAIGGGLAAQLVYGRKVGGKQG